MKLIYTEQALFSLEEALNFIAPKVTREKLLKSGMRFWMLQIPFFCSHYRVKGNHS